ncbi:hypothetical protein [Tahibacter caeni]|uniref:hypothetical protein n=1 Tax=Tahibacter caeni TaxID=1453545 RepID=UPI002147F988|nr:hypothetical protein [Tahibacter caeni]
MNTTAAGGYVQAWQCIGCGRIEAPQPCIGVCRDRKVLLVGKDEHDAALAEILRLHGVLSAASSMLLRFGAATPRDGQWENSCRALQQQVREVLAVLADAAEGAS